MKIGINQLIKTKEPQILNMDYLVWFARGQPMARFSGSLCFSIFGAVYVSQQSERVRRVVLTPDNSAFSQSWAATFRESLKKLGWTYVVHFKSAHMRFKNRL